MPMAARGIDEAQPLDFHSPYGCSKGAADQYVRDYARIYGLPTVVFRMSCIYGTRQFGTEDQGWVAHFARSILRRRGRSRSTATAARCATCSGSTTWSPRCGPRWSASSGWPGEIFNIGGGPANAVSVRDVIER
jgi:CDP-paratose 2-epimerase